MSTLEHTTAQQKLNSAGFARFFSIEDRPAANMFGVGQCQIGNQLYISDGISWSDDLNAPSGTSAPSNTYYLDIMPIEGFDSVIPEDVEMYLLYQEALITNGTLTIPQIMVDGKELEIFSNMGVTSLKINLEATENPSYIMVSLSPGTSIRFKTINISGGLYWTSLFNLV